MGPPVRTGPDWFPKSGKEPCDRQNRLVSDRVCLRRRQHTKDQSIDTHNTGDRFRFPVTGDQTKENRSRASLQSIAECDLTPPPTYELDPCEG